jgi:hypothetical protein
LTGHVYPSFAFWALVKHDEGPYLEGKMPERFLLQFQFKDGSWMKGGDPESFEVQTASLQTS